MNSLAYNLQGLGAAGDQTYTVKSGDTLSSIANYLYGDPAYYKPLASYNNIANANIICAGQVLQIPDEGVLDALMNQSPAAPTNALPAGSGSGSPAPSGAPASIVKKVASGNTTTYVIYGLGALAAVGGAYLLVKNLKKKKPLKPKSK